MTHNKRESQRITTTTTTKEKATTSSRKTTRKNNNLGLDLYSPYLYLSISHPSHTLSLCPQTATIFPHVANIQRFAAPATATLTECSHLSFPLSLSLSLQRLHSPRTARLQHDLFLFVLLPFLPFPPPSSISSLSLSLSLSHLLLLLSFSLSRASTSHPSCSCQHAIYYSLVLDRTG